MGGLVLQGRDIYFIEENNLCFVVRIVGISRFVSLSDLVKKARDLGY
ncbi:MAG: hypothetical protein AABW89_04600 [Nanoarchaeota archaeon]